LRAPDELTLKGGRDRAILAILLGCGLRRAEVAKLQLRGIQQPEEHWALVDLMGNGRHVRTVPVPDWVKAAVDEWTQAAGVWDGRLFRCWAARARFWRNGITEKVIKDFSEERTWAWRRDSLVEASKLAGDFGVTLTLQNHPPVINKGYVDTLRIAKEVASPHLKLCFDARLEHSLNEAAICKALNEVGALQTLWHYGGEYDRGPSGITLKGDEKCLAEMLGLLDIGYKGHGGFELCHPLPVVNGQTVGIDFVDKNAQLAGEYIRGILAEAKKQHAAS
jgi:hypothetical protein